MTVEQVAELGFAEKLGVLFSAFGKMGCELLICVAMLVVLTALFVSALAAVRAIMDRTERRKRRSRR